ncbi:9942_t:CDS:2, partial [Racocetra persica]
SSDSGTLRGVEAVISLRETELEEFDGSCTKVPTSRSKKDAISRHK